MSASRVFLFNYLRVEDMHRVFATVHDALLPGGQFVFSVPHPFFPFVRTEQTEPFYFSAAGKNYFRERRRGSSRDRSGNRAASLCTCSACTRPSAIILMV